MSAEWPTTAKKTENVEQLPFQRWYPITSLYRQAPDKKQFMDAMKKGGINIDGENITPIDFFATSADLSDDEIAEAIEGYLEIENLETKIEAINKSLAKAKDYIKNYLHHNLPKEVENLEEVRNVADIIKIFRRTAAAKEGEGIGLSPAYCALVSVAATSFEFRKKKMEGLTKESEYIYNAMFEIDKDTGIATFGYSKKEKTEYDRINIYDDIDQKTLSCISYFRGKDEDSLISKFINKPEASADEAAKDGIGLKFEVKDIDDLKRIIPTVTRYFKNNFNAGKFVFENTKLLNSEEINEIEEKIKRQLDMSEEETLLIKEDENEYSNKNFKAFKINGDLRAPERGDVGGLQLDRKFEIQIVLVDNENETGFSHHSVYEAAKKLSIVTRLFGSFTEEYLENICNEASLGAGLSAEKIKKYIKTNFLTKVMVRGYSKDRYASNKNVKRFLKSGIFTKDKPKQETSRRKGLFLK